MTTVVSIFPRLLLALSPYHYTYWWYYTMRLLRYSYRYASVFFHRRFTFLSRNLCTLQFFGSISKGILLSKKRHMITFDPHDLYIYIYMYTNRMVRYQSRTSFIFIHVIRNKTHLVTILNYI